METLKYGIQIKLDGYELVTIRKMIEHLEKVECPNYQNIKELFLHNKEITINHKNIGLLDGLTGYCQNGMEHDERVIELWYKLSNLNHMLSNFKEINRYCTGIYGWICP